MVDMNFASITARQAYRTAKKLYGNPTPDYLKAFMLGSVLSGIESSSFLSKPTPEEFAEIEIIISNIVNTQEGIPDGQ